MLNISSLLRDYFKNFKNIVFHLISIHVLCSLFLISFKVFFIIFNKRTYYDSIIDFLVVSKAQYFFSIKILSIFFYFLVNIDLISLVSHMLLLYWFGNLLIKFLGEKRIFMNYFSGVFLSGLFFYVLTFLNFSSNYLSACLTGIYTIIFSCIAFSSNYPINVLVFGSIKLKYVGYFLLILSLSKLSNGQIDIGLTEFFSAFWGFISIKFLSKGYDITKPFEFIYIFLKKVINYLDRTNSSIKIIYKKKKFKK